MNDGPEDFTEEKEVIFKGRRYSVRDNGYVLRHHEEGKRASKFDDQWLLCTSVDTQKNYLLFCGVPVHRIVAFAFLGEPKEKGYVVDHIDTNRHNNRADNLRWVTKFENIFLNPITRAKIVKLTGHSIEEVLADITLLQKAPYDPNYEWMKSVSKEEATLSLEHWNRWAKNNQIPGYHSSFKPIYKDSGKYPLEPIEEKASLEDYLNNLKIGEIFFEKKIRMDDFKYTITDFAYNKKEKYLAVATSLPKGLKKGYITKVHVLANKFTYETRSFFDEKGVEKYMTLAKGLEWTGGDVIDDFC